MRVKVKVHMEARAMNKVKVRSGYAKNTSETVIETACQAGQRVAAVTCLWLKFCREQRVIVLRQQ